MPRWLWGVLMIDAVPATLLPAREEMPDPDVPTT
jgi:hypothetical protein